MVKLDVKKVKCRIIWDGGSSHYFGVILGKISVTENTTGVEKNVPLSPSHNAFTVGVELH